MGSGIDIKSLTIIVRYAPILVSACRLSSTVFALGRAKTCLRLFDSNASKAVCSLNPQQIQKTTVTDCHFLYLLRVLESNQSLEVMLTTIAFATVCLWSGLYLHLSTMSGEDARHLVSTPS
jgi:hypothetical protein